MTLSPLVAFDMKGMKRVLLLTLVLFSGAISLAQIIHFQQDPETAEALYRCRESDIGTCVDSLRIDTIYTEKTSTGGLEMVVHQYPLARYEYFKDGALFRRIDIRQGVSSASYFNEDPDTGESATSVHELLIDIPNGAYHEFFPNGNIRIKGTLDGYNADGTLKKTDEWKEWDADGTVIRQETYP